MSGDTHPTVQLNSFLQLPIFFSLIHPINTINQSAADKNAAIGGLSSGVSAGLGYAGSQSAADDRFNKQMDFQNKQLAAFGQQPRPVTTVGGATTAQSYAPIPEYYGDTKPNKFKAYAS